MSLTEDQKKKAIQMAAEGRTLKSIREELNINNFAFYEFRLANPSFSNELARARQEGLEELGDSLLSIPVEEQDVQRARIRSENIRWLLSKRKPETYGDRLDLNVNQTVDIGTALAEAKKRALPQSYQPESQVEQVRDVTPQTTDTNTGAESVGMDAPTKSSDNIFD